MGMDRPERNQKNVLKEEWIPVAVVFDLVSTSPKVYTISFWI